MIKPYCGFRGRRDLPGLLVLSLVMGPSTLALAQVTKDPAISLQVSGLDGTE
ncbi:MAG: hypothetical protein H0W49_12485, partial [Nitrospirales bacterium]|nr:hypothetical protein [Nitrospirales bacterium]